MAAPKLNVRVAASALALSAAGLVALVNEESFTSTAVIPVKGDRPTVGFGSTFRDDGSPVQMGDTITPQKALARTMAHVAKDESGLRDCVKAPMTQGEWDILSKFAYQYGVRATCKSSIVSNINAGKYAQACEVYRKYTYVAGRDCKVRANKCYGVVIRAEERYQSCMAEQ